MNQYTNKVIKEYKERLKHYKLSNLFDCLAADCINKTIQGNFVLRNGYRVNSNELMLNNSIFARKEYPYVFTSLGSYTSNGTVFHNEEDELDIVDFEFQEFSTESKILRTGRRVVKNNFNDYTTTEVTNFLLKHGYDKDFSYTVSSDGIRHRILLYDAQKWIREKLGVDLVVHPCFHNGKTMYCYECLIVTEEYTDELYENTYFEKYEEALSEGIAYITKQEDLWKDITTM